ncbi:MAG: ABC transporter permease [Legionella sp.]|nr:ABC transporter permease [Legionella sp.]
MELLWTDICFLVMLTTALILLVISLRKAPTRLAFRRLLNQPLAASSGVILLFFLIVGVLDSLHFKAYTFEKNNDAAVNGSLSVLDKLMTPLGQMYEKTYSAPLALKLYSTEIVMAEGEARQIYPRLKYPQAAIKNEADKQTLIRQVLLKSLLTSFIIVSVGGLFIVGARRLILKKKYRVSKAGLSAAVTVFLCLFFLLASYWLSRHLHLLGTGKIGQDIFYYTVKSIRTGLIIGTLTTLFMLPLAIILGISAGYFGGFIDDVIQYIYTTLSSIPGVLLITASVLSMQTYIANHPEKFSTLDKSADARLLALCLILGVTSWTGLCRLLRAEALKLREIDFVLAARALGSTSFRIFYKHLLPNVMPIILITLVLDFSFLVLAEAVLSYVGVGVSPMTISWGNMINGARLELAREPIVWWPMFAAFILMFILVLASNIFADEVRDVFDPRQA